MTANVGGFQKTPLPKTEQKKIDQRKINETETSLSPVTFGWLVELIWVHLLYFMSFGFNYILLFLK